jgi:hypothetical protein
MEFYLNQKSSPIIRRCINCVFYSPNNALCGKIKVFSAYDHTKEIYLRVSDSMYCENHTFAKEEELKRDAVMVELPSIQAAMDLINSRKGEKNYNTSNNTEDGHR